MVKVVLNGRHEAKKVTIEPKLVSEDLEMLEDLVAAAINDASRKIEERSKEKYAGSHVGHESAAGHEAAVLTR